MRIELLDSFVQILNKQVEYIARDKPKAARKFKNQLIFQIDQLKSYPFKHRRSIYYNDSRIRDLVFKGYTIIYKVDESEQLISVFALIKYKDGVGEDIDL